MLVAFTIRLLALVLGAASSVFLLFLFACKRSATRVDWVTSALVLALAGWQASSAVAAFQRAITGGGGPEEISGLDQLSIGALALIPVLLIHAVMLWSGLRARWIGPLYAAVPLTWWLLESEAWRLYGWCLGTSLAISWLLCFRAARRAGSSESTRRFFLVFGAALVLVCVAAIVRGPGSASLALACLAPPLVILRWIYRYNLFGLLIRPRLVFALKVGFVFALYLLIVRALASLAEQELDIFAPVVELALILAAAMVWVPLYGWMSRFLTRRTTVYVGFGRRMIEDAARILDLRERAQFLADEVGRTFGLNRVLLLTADEPRLIACYPSGQDPPPIPEELFDIPRPRGDEIVSTAAASDPAAGKLLRATGFTYLCSLSYEDRLIGLLLLDTSPRLWLEDDESILAGLCGQISHSLATGRIIEEKIELERRLAHQEHLATLGRAAATIAHEVRNPLSSIKALAQVMCEDPELASRHSKDLGFILDEVDRLDRTVQQLLTFSRAMPATVDDVDVSELVERTAEMLAREYSSGEIHIERYVEPHLTIHKGSPEALRQILLNLALNAVQASPAGGAVRLDARASAPGKIAIAVTDDGPGVPRAVRAHMFEPFFTTRHTGTGLGLAIVHKNVEEMHGSIDVESPVVDSHGTKVTVMLPCE